VLPAAWSQQSVWGEALQKAEALGAAMPAQRDEFIRYCSTVEDCQNGIDAVRSALQGASGNVTAHAEHLVRHLLPAMDRLRTACDALERRTDEDLWPFASYHQMLFQY
jgi:glutamine synthetase type III